MLTRKVYPAIERSEANIPLVDVMCGDRLDIYEDIQSNQYFNFSLRGDRLVLLAGNHIGLIPLNDKIALLVEPKVARDNWLHIVGKANGYLKGLNYLRNYSRSDTTSQSIVEFLSRAFINLLQPVDEKGIYKQYIPYKETTSFPKGRILLHESINNIWSHGHSHSVETLTFIFTKNTAHNRLLKYALNLSIATIITLTNQPLSRERKRELNAIGVLMRDLDDLFSSVPLDSSLTYVPEVVFSLDNGAIPDMRQYYVDACRTALLLVEGAGLAPTLEGQDTSISLVVNMETIFEDYIYNILLSHAHSYGWVTVLRGNAENKSMFSGENCDTRNIEPDIVIENRFHKKIPIELKYKESPNRDNLNQAITYAVGYEVDKALLVCFTDDATKAGWQFLGNIGNQIDTWVYYINLDSKEMEAEEERFTTNLDTKINLVKSLSIIHI